MRGVISSIQNDVDDDEPSALVAASVSTDNEETSGTVRNTKSGLFSESEAEKIRVYVAGVADNDPRVATTYATERANNTNLPSAHYAVLTYESRNGILVHKSTQTPMVTAEAADDTADSLVKAYRSTLDNHNKGSKRGLKAYAAKHRHIHGGFGSLLERKWQNRPNYTPEDFAAVKSEPAVAAFIAEDDAAAVPVAAAASAPNAVVSTSTPRNQSTSTLVRREGGQLEWMGIDPSGLGTRDRALYALGAQCGRIVGLEDTNAAQQEALREERLANERREAAQLQRERDEAARRERAEKAAREEREQEAARRERAERAARPFNLDGAGDDSRPPQHPGDGSSASEGAAASSTTTTAPAPAAGGEFSFGCARTTASTATGGVGGFTFGGAAPAPAAGGEFSFGRARTTASTAAGCVGGFTFGVAQATTTPPTPQEIEPHVEIQPPILHESRKKSIFALSSKDCSHGLNGVIAGDPQNQDGPYRLDIPQPLVDSLEQMAANQNSNFLLTNEGAVYSFGDDNLGRRVENEVDALSCHQITVFDGVAQTIPMTSISVGPGFLVLVSQEGQVYFSGSFRHPDNGSDFCPPRRIPPNTTPLYVFLTAPLQNPLENGSGVMGEFDDQGDRSADEALLEAACGAAIAASTGGAHCNPRVIRSRTYDKVGRIIEFDLSLSPGVVNGLAWQLGQGAEPEFVSKFNGHMAAGGAPVTVQQLCGWDGDLRIDFRGKSTRPYQIALDVPIKRACASKHACVLQAEDGGLLTFGMNSVGQLGRAPPTDGKSKSKLYMTPMPIDAPDFLAGEKIIGVDTGLNHMIVGTSRGRAFTCGCNAKGQLGIGASDTNPHYKLTRVGLPKGTLVVQVAAGCETSHVLDSKGKIFSVGKASAGTLGIHTVHEEFVADWEETSLPRGIEMVEIKANENLLVAHSITSGGDNPDSWHTYVCGDNQFCQTGIKEVATVPFLQAITRLKDIEPMQHTIRVVPSDEVSLVLVQDYDPRWWKCSRCHGHFQLDKGYNCCMSCKEPVTDTTQIVRTTWTHNQSQASSGPGGPSFGQAAAVPGNLPGNPSSSETTKNVPPQQEDEMGAEETDDKVEDEDKGDGNDDDVVANADDEQQVVQQPIAPGVIRVGSFVTYNGEGRYRVTGTRGDTGTQWMLEGGRTWGLEKFMRLHPDQDSAL